MESGNEILSKAYRVSYALFRVAGTLPERSFRTHLEDKALDLIVGALEEKHVLLRRTVRTITYLVRFLRDTGHLHMHTADLLLKEVSDLESVVGEFSLGSAQGNPAMEIPAEELFPADSADSRGAASPVIPAEGPLSIPNVPGRNDVVEVVAASYGPSLAMKQLIPKGNAEIPGSMNSPRDRQARNDRQSRMIAIIRQSGNLPEGCRLKDIQQALPSVSERTLRYDLQRLIEEGMIIRQGSGGPATYYKLSH